MDLIMKGVCTMTDNIMLEIAGHGVVLDRPCLKCGWVGYIQPADEAEAVVECKNCGGIGYLPTDRGEKILKFISRHLGDK